MEGRSRRSTTLSDEGISVTVYIMLRLGFWLRQRPELGTLCPGDSQLLTARAGS
jgi:hypothetical protein